MSIIEPRILKGTRDFGPDDMAKRDLVMGKIRAILQRYGFDTIETPILNYAETILGKYGEEGDRLTYHFDDAGKRHIALPYDITVPVARFVSTHAHELPLPFKQYAIQRVWRAEKPQKGRLREFYQCEVNVIGTRSLVADAEIARVMAHVFRELDLDVTIKVNSRRLMNQVIESLGPIEDPNEVIRAIDKMDKIGRDGVTAQLTKVGLSEDQIEPLFDAFENQKFDDFDTTEIDEFLTLCDEFGIRDVIKFDPYLARGLDYYTGIIYEVTSNEMDLGSICGGGRFDDLCSMFSKQEFPGVGVAFGFERIMIILNELGKLGDIPLSAQVMVAYFDEEGRANNLAMIQELTDAGINSFMYVEPAKLAKQFKYADRKKVPLVLTAGPDERANNQVTLKNMLTGEQETISRADLLAKLS